MDKTCGSVFAGGGRVSHLQALFGSGRRAADSRKTYKITEWKVLPKPLGDLWNLLERSCDAGIISWAVFAAPSVLLKTSGIACGPFGYLLGPLGSRWGLLGSLLGASWEPFGVQNGLPNRFLEGFLTVLSLRHRHDIVFHPSWHPKPPKNLPKPPQRRPKIELKSMTIRC